MRRLARVFAHVDRRSTGLEASPRSDAAALGASGMEPNLGEGYGLGIGWLFAEAADPHPAASVHLAFQGHERGPIDRFHKAASSVCGMDDGAPGPRDLEPSYHAASVLGTDGSNVTAVFDEGSMRGAPLVAVAEA